MQSTRNKLLLTASTASLASLSLIPLETQARPVVPGQSNVPLTGVTSSDLPELPGQTLAQQTLALEIFDPITHSPAYRGALNTTVIKAPSKKLTFVYQIVGDESQPAPLGQVFRLTTFNLASRFDADVDYLVDSIGEARPTGVSRGDTWLDFTFDDTLGPGESSQSFFLRTNATDFDTSGFAIADALVDSEDPFSGNVRSGLIDGIYRPVLVPLPGAVYTGAICMVMVYAGRRRITRWMGLSR